MFLSSICHSPVVAALLLNLHIKLFVLCFVFASILLFCILSFCLSLSPCCVLFVPLVLSPSPSVLHFYGLSCVVLGRWPNASFVDAAYQAIVMTCSYDHSEWKRRNRIPCHPATHLLPTSRFLIEPERSRKRPHLRGHQIRTTAAGRKKTPFKWSRDQRHVITARLCFLSVPRNDTFESTWNVI